MRISSINWSFLRAGNIVIEGLTAYKIDFWHQAQWRRGRGYHRQRLSAPSLVTVKCGYRWANRVRAHCHTQTRRFMCRAKALTVHTLQRHDTTAPFPSLLLSPLSSGTGLRKTNDLPSTELKAVYKLKHTKQRQAIKTNEWNNKWGSASGELAHMRFSSSFKWPEEDTDKRQKQGTTLASNFYNKWNQNKDLRNQNICNFSWIFKRPLEVDGPMKDTSYLQIS